MAYFLFTNDDGSTYNLGDLANWRNSNASGTDGGAASRLPTSTDIVWIYSPCTIVTGTLNASSATLVFDSNPDVTLIEGGTFNCTLDDGGNGGSSGAFNISGGTFNKPVTMNSASGSSWISGGTFNGALVMGQGGGTVSGGTFNSNVTAAGVAFTGGKFNAPIIANSQSSMNIGLGGVTGFTTAKFGTHSYGSTSAITNVTNKIDGGMF